MKTYKNCRMFTVNIIEFSLNKERKSKNRQFHKIQIIYTKPPLRNTITLYTNVQCQIRMHIVMYTADHAINKLIGRSVVYIWAKLHLFVLLLYWVLCLQGTVNLRKIHLFAELQKLNLLISQGEINFNFEEVSSENNMFSRFSSS